MIEIILVVLASSFLITFFAMPILIRKLLAAGITGRDVNKSGQPEVAEMGGLGIIMGAIGSLLIALAFYTFMGVQFNLIQVLAAMLTLMIIALIGTYDDLFEMRQATKAVLPMVAALPLVAVSAAGSTQIALPFVGTVDFGYIYIIFLIPLGVTVASNLTNMLAGFNGLEAGMGAVMFATILILAAAKGIAEMGMVAAAMLGALLAFLKYNWYPAKVFAGDIGNLSIGAALATAVIIGNLESAGAILVIPHVIDFFIKAYNGFPSKKWWGELRQEKLYPLEGKVRGAAQLVMKLAGGISEKNLVIVFMAAEIACGLAAIVLLLG
ncbi:MAG: hypothetical protein N3G80_03645 [Candidatus Micrarchaeota archaeon]|nr:hypothetical protein [Candidatus Micrarchaeota archaeon]